MALNLTLDTPPVNLAVSLADAKSHLRVDHEDEDILIRNYIIAATERLDGRLGILGRCLITQTWTMRLDSFPASIALPFAPVQSITSIDYTDTANNPQTVTATDYEFEAGEYNPCITLATGISWPSTATTRGAASVTFIAGYGPDPKDIPGPITQALLLIIGHFYRNREAEMTGPISTEIKFGVDTLTAPYRRLTF